MKKLVIIMAALVLTLAVSAQKRGGVYYRPRTYVVVGGGFGYSPFYSPFYSPWYYPGYGYNSYYHRPTKLDMQIADIKSDYADRISSVKHDTSLSHRERRKEVHNLRHERDEAVLNAKRNYHLTR